MTDYFDVLGLPRTFAIEAAELERCYLERSREVHPDRGGGSAGEAMTVNQAYRTLKRALGRAEHLLSLAGVAIGANEPVDPALLAEMLELREELADAQSSGDQGALMRLEQEARRRHREEIERLGPLFRAFEADGADADAGVADDIKQQVIRLRYLARYVEAFDDDEDAAGGAAA